MSAFNRFSRVLAAASVLFAASQAFAAEDGAWSVSKSSGEVWISTAGVQQASLKTDDNLKPGDTIRTGRNGRVLLVRGEETILIAPNSVIGLPVEKKDGLSTTIMQQAGSILLEVEKKNVKHFEVETPYLAAVVKGTQFRVSVNGASTNVEVMRGQVEVADFKSGQIAQVLPGQSATAFEHGKPGLSLSGSGAFNPIEQGKPRASSVDRIPVPKTGLTSPRNAANGQSIRALAANNAVGKSTANSAQGHAAGGSLKHAVTRISSAIGEVKLNFHKVTHGLARSATATSGTGRSGAKDTVWSSSGSGSSTASSSQPSSSDVAASSASSATASSSATAASSAPSVVAVVTNSGSNNGNGSGNSNGNGNGNGANGNANGNGNGNGNANSHGNNGNGHAYGHTKH